MGRWCIKFNRLGDETPGICASLPIRYIYSWVFQMDTDFYLCEVRTEVLYSRLPSHCGGRGSISRQSTWDLWWTEWHRDRFFFSEYFGFTLPESFHQCFILILIYMLLLTRRTNGRSTGTFQEAVLFRKSGSIEQKSTFDFFYSSIKLSWFWANSA